MRAANITSRGGKTRGKKVNTTEGFCGGVDTFPEKVGGKGVEVTSGNKLRKDRHVQKENKEKKRPSSKRKKPFPVLSWGGGLRKGSHLGAGKKSYIASKNQRWEHQRQEGKVRKVDKKNRSTRPETKEGGKTIFTKKARKKRKKGKPLEGPGLITNSCVRLTESPVEGRKKKKKKKELKKGPKKQACSEKERGGQRLGDKRRPKGREDKKTNRPGHRGQGEKKRKVLRQ